MVSQKYRWDFIGLSTDTKPTSETSEKVVNGSTYYCSDTSKLYVYCDGTWYERKPLGGGGGTSDFNELTNRPKYNGADMTGSTNIPEVVTYSDFTGTDGTSAGAAGLVPAPATTDAGYFLSASGLWEEVAGGGSGIIELTSADYNYPTDNPTQIAAWLLPDGIYHSASTAIQWSAYGDSAPSGTFIKTTNSSNMAFVFFYRDNGLNEVILSQAISAAHYTNLSTSSVKQSTGTSTTDVMSQNAVTSMVYADPASRNKLQLGKDAVNMGNRSGDAIGKNAFVASGTNDALAVGYNAAARATNSVAIGSQSNATAQGEVSIGNPTRTDLYNNTGYRLLTGLYDGQSAHDAATVAQGNTLSTSAPTTSTVGVLGQLYTDTTNMHTYQCTAISGDTYTWTQRW